MFPSGFLTKILYAFVTSSELFLNLNKIVHCLLIYEKMKMSQFNKLPCLMEYRYHQE
jgi:hypothetical protein